MLRRLLLLSSTPLLFASAAAAQPCQDPLALQLRQDALPANPAGQQNVAVIAGICPGDKAAAVFDIGVLPKPLEVLEGGILMAGPLGSQPMTVRMEIYDGVTFLPNGQAVMGPLVYQDLFANSFTPNALNLVNITGFGTTVTSDKLVVAFTIVTNPNEVFPGLGCTFGYTANFASDTQLPPSSPCATPSFRNLIFDPGQGGWWDITQFTIGGTPWCGVAFNGSWIIRACVKLPTGANSGTGDDVQLATAAGTTDPSALAKTANAGDFLQLGMQSAGGTFVAGFLLMDFYATAGPVPIGFAPGFRLANTPVVLGPGNMLPTFAQGFPIPPGLEGITVMVQGAVLDLGAQNGLYGTTDAHVILIQ